MRRPLPALGRSATGKKKLITGATDLEILSFYIFIYTRRRKRVSKKSVVTLIKGVKRAIKRIFK